MEAGLSVVCYYESDMARRLTQEGCDFADPAEGVVEAMAVNFDGAFSTTITVNLVVGVTQSF